jgi:hypothetical protein
MTADRLKALIEELDRLRRQLLTLDGDDPNDPKRYQLFAPAPADAMAGVEECFGAALPESYREFLANHNGWKGFWQGWSLVGIPTDQNQMLLGQVKKELTYLPDVADTETLERLKSEERSDDTVIAITNHPIFGVDFNGGLLVFDSNRRDAEGEPQVVWARYLTSVERRFDSFEALLEAALADTKSDVDKGGSF